MQKQLGQEVTRLANNKFQSVWHGVPDSQLVLNFNPIIDTYNLTGVYVLLHWQAKPKNLRTWGIYDSQSKMYYSVGSDELVFPPTKVRVLDVPETIIKTVPTAVLMFEGVSWVNGKIT